MSVFKVLPKYKITFYFILISLALLGLEIHIYNSNGGSEFFKGVDFDGPLKFEYGDVIAYQIANSFINYPEYGSLYTVVLFEVIAIAILLVAFLVETFKFFKPLSILALVAVYLFGVQLLSDVLDRGYRSTGMSVLVLSAPASTIHSLATLPLAPKEKQWDFRKEEIRTNHELGVRIVSRIGKGKAVALKPSGIYSKRHAMVAKYLEGLKE